MISALVPHVRSCRESLDAQAVSNALYGMQGMNSDNVEVCALISALVPHMRSCRESLSAQNVSNALYGIRGHISNIVLCSFIDMLYSSILKLSVDMKSCSDVELISMGQSVALCLPALREHLNPDDYRMWEHANAHRRPPGSARTSPRSAC